MSFEKASRLKLRFETTKGPLTAEDLWDLPLTSDKTLSLDKVAQSLDAQLKQSANVSFVVKTTKVNDELQLKFDIAKHIIDVRLAEAAVAADAKSRKEKKDRILAVIAKKQDEKLEGASLEELQKELESL